MDEYFKIFDEIIAKTMNVKIPFELFNYTHIISPEFVSIVHKTLQEGFTNIRNGYTINSYDDITKGYRTKVMIGDERGFGAAFLGSENIPESTEGLKKNILRSMDSSIKVALQSYIGGATQLIQLKDNPFIKQAKAPTAEYYENIEQNNQLIQPTEKEIREFEKITKQISKMAHVQDTTINLEAILLEERFMNSEGTKIRTKNNNGRATINIIVPNKNGYTQSIYNAFLYQEKEELNQILTIGNNIKKLQQEVKEIYEATRIMSGQYPVIMDGSLFGTFFHEAIAAHLLSGKYVAEGISSIFEGKIGCPVMPEFLSVYDKPNLQNGYGSFKFDDEGVRAKNVTLVKNGILKNYLLDRSSAEELNMKNNGRSRSEWVVGQGENGMIALQPEPRISNLIIKATNPLKEKDLILQMRKHCQKNNIEYGLYISGLSGEVDVRNGSFQLEPDKIIAVYQNGKTERKVGGIINGNAFTALNSILACSNKHQLSYGQCGASSGWVPTQEKAPSAFFPQMDLSSPKTFQTTKKLI